jgi:hypothetical protein
MIFIIEEIVQKNYKAEHIIYILLHYYYYEKAN